MQIRATLAATLLCASTVSLADGFYVGTGIGVSMIDDVADTGDLIFTTPVPAEIPLGGRRFDTDETSWGMHVGWQATDWFALELGYTDLGNAGDQLLFSVFGPIIVPTLTPPPAPPPPGPAIFSAVPRNEAAMEIEEWSVAAKFRKPLFSKLSANWMVAVTRAEFDAAGSFTFNNIVSITPLVINRVQIPYASPGSETGFAWGLGFGWQLSERFSLDLGYRSRDTKVIDVETITLQVLANL